MTKNLRTIVTGFRKGLLGRRKSTNMCFAVCAPLVPFLQLSGYQCELIRGEIYNFDHFWIALPNGEIIDPTADQFDNPDGQPMPPVYIGPRPEWYLDGNNNYRIMYTKNPRDDRLPQNVKYMWDYLHQQNITQKQLPLLAQNDDYMINLKLGCRVP